MASRKPYSRGKYLQYLLARAIFVPIKLMPLTAAYAAARWVGRVFFRLLPEHRKIALDNVRLALGDQLSERQVHEMARRSFENMALNLVEIVRFAAIVKRKDLDEHFEIEGLEHGLAAHGEGRGAIFVSGHIGNWELCSLVIRRRGIPFCAVAKPLPNGYLDDHLTALRESCGQRIVKKRGALKEMIKEVRGGGALGFLIDQNARTHGVMVKFFGRDASTISSVASLAMRLKVPVMAGACFRTGRGFKFRIVCLPPLKMVDTGDHRADVITNTQTMTDAIEQLIRRDPSQWLWGHNRWRIKESWFDKGRLGVRRTASAREAREP